MSQYQLRKTDLQNIEAYLGCNDESISVAHHNMLNGFCRRRKLTEVLTSLSRADDDDGGFIALDIS